MGRCRKQRCCRRLPDEVIYKPAGIPLCDMQIIELAPDEFESMRLCDLEGKSQIQAAQKMLISRGTIQRLLESGRAKVVQVILNNSALQIKTE